ncbi:hypothetical protein [Arsenicicoccus dermatophilus]|uniref:hypothetical protein n=1 Tax=Arsenicicoccus dermatophilus TaxID=1076331 RepID=UPI001F4D0906|nr:hypothetical protein [Arsenicicoccus dermatophilus]MCH8611489.1 hypothetical protein [Arsenicicoccus dermatophilus]
MNVSAPRATAVGHAITLLAGVAGIVVGLLGRSTVGGWGLALVGLLVFNGLSAASFLVWQTRIERTPGPAEARSALSTTALSLVFLAQLLGRAWPEHESWSMVLVLVGLCTMVCAFWLGSRGRSESADRIAR